MNRLDMSPMKMMGTPTAIPVSTNEDENIKVGLKTMRQGNKLSLRKRRPKSNNSNSADELV